jgi:hypothetical protein
LGRRSLKARIQQGKDQKARILDLAAVERARRRQSSRIAWLKDGDACTRFFHLCKRKAAEKLHPCFAQTRPVPGILYTQWEKETISADYFNNIIGLKESRTNAFNWDLLNLTCLTNVMAEPMDRPFSELEVRQAIQQLPSEKAPGPDSFTGVFYCCCWNIIKGEVLNASSSFHHLYTSTLPQRLRLMELTSPSSQKWRQLMNPRIFRPISLIHSFAKLVSKVLSIRFCKHINNLVSTSQSAFIKKRCIQDNFLYVRNLA